MKCPLCNINTDIIDLAGVELDYCYNCTGIWFDKGEILEVIQRGSVNKENSIIKVLEDMYREKIKDIIEK